MTDTVGFIQKLPTALVAPFRATLEEIDDFDLLLHVIDITHGNALQQADTVGEVLRELGVIDKPIVSALNRWIFCRIRRPRRMPWAASFPTPSDFSGDGVGRGPAAGAHREVLNRSMEPVEALIPYSAGDLVNLWHVHGLIEVEEHTDHGVHLRGLLPKELAGQFEPFAHTTRHGENGEQAGFRGVTQAPIRSINGWMGSRVRGK